MKKIKRNPNRWIFTKERLPKESKWYLVIDSDGYITADLFSKVTNDFSIKNRVAWIEIPAPPVKGALRF